MTEQIGTYSQNRLDIAKEYLMPIFKNMTLLQMFIVTAIVWTCCVAFTILIEHHIRKKYQNQNNNGTKNSPRDSDENKEPTKRAKVTIFLLNLIKIVLYTISVFSCICFLQGLYLNKIGHLHGCDTIKKYTISEMYQTIDILPVESKLPETSLKNKLIIYYKFGCGDCESIHNDLNEELQDYKNVYFIYTRSKQGKQLRKDYPVEKVPSGLYIQSDGKAVTLPLYTIEHDKPVLDQQNLNTLLQLFQNHV